MNQILVSGLINFETTLRVDSFPIAYNPVCYPFYGVRSTISGVGYNVVKALKILGHDPTLISLIGKDIIGELVFKSLAKDGLRSDCVYRQLEETAQSVILYDRQGKRQIHVDLKDIQEQTCPAERLIQLIIRCRLAVLCNINFSRPILSIARQAGVPIATDVHAISSLDDPYNQDFMAQANILFMSHENLPVPPQEWARVVFSRYKPEILVIGMGAAGALLGIGNDQSTLIVPAVNTRPVVNTIGAGDALFASFLHAHLQGLNPYHALRNAVVFASHKIGATGAADGFLDAASLDYLVRTIYP